MPRPRSGNALRFDTSISTAIGVKLKLESPVRFTPTFVLVDGDREIGRIEGYPGEDFFWGRLERLMPRPQADVSNEAAR